MTPGSETLTYLFNLSLREELQKKHVFLSDTVQKLPWPQPPLSILENLKVNFASEESVEPKWCWICKAVTAR